VSRPRIIYEAEWVKELLPLRYGKEFDPYKDVRYAQSEHATFEEAREAALRNEGGYGYATVFEIQIHRTGRRSTLARKSVL